MKSITTMGTHRKPVTVQSMADKLERFQSILKNLTGKYPNSSLVHEVLSKLQKELDSL